ncbi:TPA: hypothetical protein OFX50_004636 [Escherichia coli]|nr:hypothetical protein [Escherichia coli]HCP7955945.1 hypothetical protein [Escherichia coli]HCP9327915.1 hypothetical protein [Escherichia coli]
MNNSTKFCSSTFRTGN